MTRRSFLRSLCAAVAMAPALCRLVEKVCVSAPATFDPAKYAGERGLLPDPFPSRYEWNEMLNSFVRIDRVEMGPGYMEVISNPDSPRLTS